SVETPNDREIAVHLFVFDELAEPGQRVLALLQDVEGPLGAVSAGQPIVARLDAGRDLATVARAAPPAGILRVEHDGVATAARHLQGCIQSCVAGADDGNIHGARQRLLLRLRARHLIPPVRGQLAVVCKKPVRHRSCSVDPRNLGSIHTASSSKRSAPFSPTMMVGAFVLPDVRVGKMEASITRSASNPWARRRLSTTDVAGSGPIRHVPTGWNTLEARSRMSSMNSSRDC